jgi:RHS repeat-associated protein
MKYGRDRSNEYEDEGELNYSNTFYRKYDAQIGRFTGVDMKAEEFVGLTPYNFGGNNPVMFNDPMGDKFGGRNKEREAQHIKNPIGFDSRGDFYSSIEMFSSEGGGGGGGRDYSAFWQSFLGAIWDATPDGKDKNFYDVKYECFNVYYKNEFIGYVEKILFSEYKSYNGKDVNGVQVILGFKSKSDKFTEFNWVQNVITTHILPEKGESGEFVYRDGYYYYADYTKGNKPYYNSSWNDNKVNSGEVDKNSNFGFLGNYTTVFSDTPWRGELVNNVYWLASLSLVANTKNGGETLINFYYGFQVDGNSKVNLINFGQSASNPYWFTNYLLGLKF